MGMRAQGGKGEKEMRAQGRKGERSMRTRTGGDGHVSAKREGHTSAKRQGKKDMRA